jgi:hypothetical protein
MTLGHRLIAAADRDIHIVVRACHPPQEEVERPAVGDPQRRLAGNHGRESASQIHQRCFGQDAYHPHSGAGNLVTSKEGQLPPPDRALCDGTVQGAQEGVLYEPGWDTRGSLLSAG